MDRSEAQAGLSSQPSGSTTPLLGRGSPPSIASSVATSSSTSTATRRYINTIRTISFATAILAALCGNSISVFSLYSPVLQHRLHYTQFQVNGLANAASIALYIPVSFAGYVCDRFGPVPLSITAAACFGIGYGLAAILFNHVDLANQGLGNSGADLSWTYPVMVACFLLIGVGTCCMYLSSVAVTAKNFGKGQYRGLMLAIPITCFGLSGMWLSQFGSWVLCERNPDGSRGDVNVYTFFIFLAGLLAAVGILCAVFLRVVNEEELIEEAVEELAGSGILDGSALLSRHNSMSYSSMAHNNGTTDRDVESGVNGDGDQDGPKDDEDEEPDAQWKKNFLLNAETRRFLTDHTMWWLAVGFFLIIGPGEAFINNMGTVINTLYNPSAVRVSPDGIPRTQAPTSPATHVSIVAFTSTAARILTGTLSDLLAPKTTTDHPQVPTGTPMNRRTFLGRHRRGVDSEGNTRFSVSRVTFLLGFALTMSLGFIAQASGLMQDHGERFWVVSSLVGLGYGGVFSITPIIITVIWGVENFATNWGIVAMVPAVGSVLWGFIYSAVYTAGAKAGSGTDPGDLSPISDGDDNQPPSNGDSEELFCYGTQCYSLSFWAMTVSVWAGGAMALWAWKGRRGWASRNVVV